MYGYRTKNKILSEFLRDMAKNTDYNIEHNTHSVSLTNFSKKIGGKKYLTIARYITYMAIDDFFEMTEVPESDDMNVIIRPKGLKAALSDTYSIKQNEYFWRATMNILITLANIFVAITAIWALTKSGNEIEKIQSRLEKLEKMPPIKEVKANPNTLNLQSSSPTIAKDAADTAKHK